ncbi:MAG: sugar ABC transporter permease [Candidatus Hydrogenedentes bacterium]|nr:sugar ABC transporter permease [Candidatus Hydrogenedentota bacterium]
MGRRTKQSWKRNRAEWLTFLAFVSPNLVLFALFTYWPIVYSAYLSFMDWNLLTARGAFVELANYRVVFTDPQIRTVIGNTLIYACAVVCVAQALAFALALLLNRNVRGQVFFRTLAFAPHVTTTAAAALVWVLLLDPDLGPSSVLYNALGIHGPHFLASSKLALWAIVSIGVWKEVGFASIFFLAGLQTLPRDCYEAAELETDSGWKVFRHLTLPLMSPVVFFLSVSGFIAAIKAFDVVSVMTQGGPVYPASSTYVYHLYRLAFQEFRAGDASAFAVVFFVITVAITGLQFRLARKWVHYGD